MVAGEAGAALMVTPWVGAAPVTHASCLDLASLGAAEVNRLMGAKGRGAAAPAPAAHSPAHSHRITRAAPMDGVGAGAGGLAHTVPRLVRTSLGMGMSVVKKKRQEKMEAAQG